MKSIESGTFELFVPAFSRGNLDISPEVEDYTLDCDFVVAVTHSETNDILDAPLFVANVTR